MSTKLVSVKQLGPVISFGLAPKTGQTLALGHGSISFDSALHRSVMLSIFSHYLLRDIPVHPRTSSRRSSRPPRQRTHGPGYTQFPHDVGF